MRSLSALILAGLLTTSPELVAADPPAKKKQPSLPPGMRVYFVGLLKKGPKWNPADGEEMEKTLSDHLSYIAKLEKEGKVAVEGTFLGASSLRGMVIFKVRSMAEARAIVKDDPAVESRRLLVDLYPWMSADGLRVVPPTAPRRPPAKAPPKKGTPGAEEPSGKKSE